MARRKRKDDEPDWVAPDFDEVGYMRRELEGARAAVATIGWAVIGALVAFALYSVLPVLAFFAGIAVGAGMYFVFPLIGIKTDAFKRRDWIGHGFTYFFSWLAFWIILLNPPFSDHTDPTIQGISISPYHAGYTGPLLCHDTTSTAFSMGASNNSLYLLFRASDNVGLRSVHVTVAPNLQTPYNATPTLVTGPNQCVGHRQETYLGGTYNATFPWTTSEYDITIVAVDTSGNPPTVVAFHVVATP